MSIRLLTSFFYHAWENFRAQAHKSIFQSTKFYPIDLASIVTLSINTPRCEMAFVTTLNLFTTFSCNIFGILLILDLANR